MPSFLSSRYGQRLETGAAVSEASGKRVRDRRVSARTPNLFAYLTKSGGYKFARHAAVTSLLQDKTTVPAGRTSAAPTSTSQRPARFLSSPSILVSWERIQ